MSIIEVSSISVSQLRDEIRQRKGTVTRKAKRPYLERYLSKLLGLYPKPKGVQKTKKVPPIRPIPIRATASEAQVRAPMRAYV